MSLTFTQNVQMKKFEILNRHSFFNITFTFNRNGGIKRFLDGLAMEEHYWGRPYEQAHLDTLDSVYSDYESIAQNLSKRYKGKVRLTPKTENMFEFNGQRLSLTEIKRIIFTDFSENMSDDLKVLVSER